MAIKHDLEEAYDGINWEFLEKVLRVMGLQEHLVKIIMFYVTLASLSVIWNGEVLEKFQPSRGLRQGDSYPLSFFLCIEVLSQKIQ